jgi:ribose transport system permease protein
MSSEPGMHHPETSPGDVPPDGSSGADPALDTGPRQPSDRSRAIRRFLASSPLYMAAVLIVLIVIFSILKPHAFPTTFNAKNIVLSAATFVTMATGMTYVMVAGGFDISIGSILVFADVVAAKTMDRFGDHGYLTVLVGLVVAMLAGTAWGIFNGFCITKLRVPALITTLGTLGAALGVAQLITKGNDVRDVPNSVVKVSSQTFLGFGWLVWIAAVIALVGGLVLHVTRFGRHTYVIGSNPEAARRAGINVDRHLLKLYGISGLLAGVAGMMSLTRFTTTDISGHSTDALTVITAVVLGGTSLFGGIGTVIGTVVGVFIPTVLNNGFIVINVQPFWQQVAIGFVLIIAVYLDQIKRRQRDRG